MRKVFLAAILLLSCICGRGQSLQNQFVQEGWTFNPVPLIGYSSELGVMFGASADIFNYGTPTVYPDCLDRIHIETVCYTGGEGNALLEYESSSLIPGVRFSSAIGYTANKLNKFYGFGGDVTEYDRSIDCRNGLAFYSYDRQSAIILASFEGVISSRLKWMGGVSLRYCNTGESKHRKYDGENSLYHLYRMSGIISDSEIRGWTAEMKGGIEYDSRDNRFSPEHGIYADLSVYVSPDIFSSGYSYAKASAHFRHYLTPGPSWLTLAYHLAYQGTIAGDAPFFQNQTIYGFDNSPRLIAGLGGYDTIRGILPGRLVGKSYAWANLEARFKLVTFSMAGADCYFGINPFFDIGAIVQPYKIKEISEATGEDYDLLMDKSRRPHESAGMGIKLCIDKSSIISLEMAKSFNRNDGPLQITAGVNYIF